MSIFRCMEINGLKFSRVREDLDGVFVANENGEIFKMTKVIPYLKAGYVWVRLPLLGKQKPFNLARLVLSAFHPEHDADATVDHIDCNKENNSISNLQWLSRKENLSKAVSDGKLGRSVYKFDLNGAFVTAYPSIAAAADDNKIHIKDFGNALRNRPVVMRGEYMYSFSEFILEKDFLAERERCWTNKPTAVAQYVDGKLFRSYPSIYAACARTGFSREAIRRALSKGSLLHGYSFKRFF